VAFAAVARALITRKIMITIIVMMRMRTTMTTVTTTITVPNMLTPPA
jgi:hypothetical protein